MPILRLNQGTPEWLEARKTRITSTDASIINGTNPFKSSFELWQQKLDLIPPDHVNARMAYGTEQEPIARTAFEQKIGIEFAPMVYANEWQMASLDGINLDGDCILEIKCGEKAYKAAKEGKIPEYYITQMMHAMHVVGCETCHYWAFFKGEGIHIRLESNDAFIKALIEKEEEFYTWIQKKEPNPVWLGHGEN